MRGAGRRARDRRDRFRRNILVRPPMRRAARKNQTRTGSLPPYAVLSSGAQSGAGRARAADRRARRRRLRSRSRGAGRAHAQYRGISAAVGAGVKVDAVRNFGRTGAYPIVNRLPRSPARRRRGRPRPAGALGRAQDREASIRIVWPATAPSAVSRANRSPRCVRSARCGGGVAGCRTISPGGAAEAAAAAAEAVRSTFRLHDRRPFGHAAAKVLAALLGDTMSRPGSSCLDRLSASLQRCRGAASCRNGF